jgi:hypothetical protein
MKTKKWFYEIQANLDRVLHDEYEMTQTQWQEVTKERVYELKICRKQDSATIEVLLCVMTRATKRYSIFKCIES